MRCLDIFVHQRSDELLEILVRKLRAEYERHVRYVYLTLNKNIILNGAVVVVYESLSSLQPAVEAIRFVQRGVHIHESLRDVVRHVDFHCGLVLSTSARLLYLIDLLAFGVLIAHILIVHYDELEVFILFTVEFIGNFIHI